MNEYNNTPPAVHRVELDGRERLTILGVEDVERFDETGIVLSTSAGVLTVTGEDLHLGNPRRRGVVCCIACSAEPMENHVSVQLLVFGESILLGLAAGLLYDLLRPLRLRVPPLAGFLDSLYCLSAAAAVFLFTLRQAQGQLRFYVLLGIAGGGALFFGIFSAPLRPVWDFWADAAADLLRLVAIPFRKMLAVCKKMWKAEKNLFYFCNKYYTIESTKQGRARFLHKGGGAHGIGKGTGKGKTKSESRLFHKAPDSRPAGRAELAAGPYPQSGKERPGRESATDNSGFRQAAGERHAGQGNRKRRKSGSDGRNRP